MHNYYVLMKKIKKNDRFEMILMLDCVTLHGHFGVSITTEFHLPIA